MNTFETLILDETPVLVDFSAEWCGPCKMMAPILQELKQQMGDKVKVVKIDVDKNPQASMKYQVQAVPTLMLFQKGKQLWRQSGVVPATRLKQIIDPYTI